MRAMSKLMWATAGVGTIGVMAGVGLMFAGDWLGRRDERALQLAVTGPLRTLSETAQTMIPLIPEQTLAEFQRHMGSPTEPAIAQAAAAITVVSDQQRVVDRQQIVEATGGNPFTLLSQTPMVPHLAGSQSGLRIASVADSPWVDKLGMEAGDVVTAINGDAVLDPRKMPNIARALLTAPEIDITLQRTGQEVTLHYSMESAARAPISPGSP